MSDATQNKKEYTQLWQTATSKYEDPVEAYNKYRVMKDKASVSSSRSDYLVRGYLPAAAQQRSLPWSYPLNQYDRYASLKTYFMCLQKLMKPGGPLAHVSKDQVTWKQVQETHAREKRARDSAGAFEVRIPQLSKHFFLYSSTQQ